jgi:hypothetical protein
LHGQCRRCHWRAHWRLRQSVSLAFAGGPQKQLFLPPKWPLTCPLL